MAGTRKKPAKKTVKPGKDIVESTAEDLKNKLIKTLDQDIKELVIDFKNVKTIDSTGVGVLIAARNSVDQADVQLSLINAPENIKSLLQVIGLDGYFNISAA